MRQNNVNGKKCFTQYSQYRCAPVQYYLQKISMIKNDNFQVNNYCKQPLINTRTDFTSSFTDLKRNQLSVSSKKKDYQKKRSMSTKTQIEITSIPNVSKFNTKTLYGANKFQSGHLNLFSKLSDPDQRIKQRTVSNFKVNLNRKSNLSQGKHYLSQNKIFTQPCEDSNRVRENSQVLNTQQPEYMSSTIKQQNAQTVKKNIFTKISLYVQSLDQKGEQQLTHMLIGKYKKHIKCHTDVVLYQDRIKQMIKTNKEIVNILKEEFLSPRKVKLFSQRNFKNSPKNNVCSTKQLLQMGVQSSHQKNQSLFKKIVIDDLQVDLPQQSVEFQKNKSIISINSTKPIAIMQSSQNLSKAEQLYKSPQQADSPRSQQPQDYNQQMKHVTNQFVNQWQKSKIHKKEIYQKFRKTLFKKFPEFRERQIKRNKQLNLKPKQDDMSDYQDAQNEDIFNSKINLDGLKEAQMKSIENKKTQTIKSPQNKKQIQQQKSIQQARVFTHSHQKQIYLIKNSSLSNNYHQREQLIPLKQTTNELSKSLSKITLLSKKNSLSKGSARTLSIFRAENKKQVDKFNFQNLVEFIFKRAFFYSVSKKKIIQNKTEMIPLEITSPVQKKKPQYSFITYNSKAQEKRNLRTSKLNEKKLRATGNFLIKNKFNIMQMQQQGHKSYDFLRKCIQDAIQDYVGVSKKK